MDADGPSEPPDAYCCPIGLDIMVDPVFLIETGHTYERAMIEAHLARSDRAPLSGVQLQSKALMPNHALRQAIEAYLAERGKAPPSAPQTAAVGPPPPTAPPPARVSTIIEEKPPPSETNFCDDPHGRGVWVSRKDEATGVLTRCEHAHGMHAHVLAHGTHVAIPISH